MYYFSSRLHCLVSLLIWHPFFSNQICQHHANWPAHSRNAMHQHLTHSPMYIGFLCCSRYKITSTLEVWWNIATFFVVKRKIFEHIEFRFRNIAVVTLRASHYCFDVKLFIIIYLLERVLWLEAASTLLT